MTLSDAAYRDYLAKKQARAAEIEAARAEDPTWNGTGRTRGWSRAAAKRAAINRRKAKGPRQSP